MTPRSAIWLAASGMDLVGGMAWGMDGLPAATAVWAFGVAGIVGWAFGRSE